MKTTLKALAAGAVALALAGPASAHVDVRIHAGPPAYYYPPVAHVHPRYAPPPVYYVYVDPAWDRRDRHWRHHHWRHNHWRHHGHHHGHHRRHGWDSRY